MDVFLMVLCVVLSAFFSATETAYSCSNKIKLKSLSDNGNKKAEGVLRILDRYDKMLTAVLIGNNIVNIALASIATVFFIKRISPESGAAYSTVAVTLTVLVFGEITPKTLAGRIPEKLAMLLLPAVRLIVIVFFPLAFVFAAWAKLLGKIVGKDNENTITDDELMTFVNEAYDEGGLDEGEKELISNAITFDDMQAEDILTPRVDIAAVESGSSFETVEKCFSESGYSRIPVYEGTLDNIVGIIHQKDFYDEAIRHGTDFSKFMKKPLFVAPTMKISKLLKELQREKTHIAVVVDEYGGTAGIVTMEDILEELVGEIWDEHDEVEEDILKIGENKYRVMGQVLLSDMFEFFKVREDISDSDTVAGWVMEKTGHIPRVGDCFEYLNLVITISEIISRRITVVEISVKQSPAENCTD